MSASPEHDPAAPFDAEPELPDPLPDDPWPLFTAWLEEARLRAVSPNPNSMVLATVGADARPSARVVLCKKLLDAGAVVFFTNYESRKATELEAGGRAAVVFHWDYLERQVRIEGPVTRSPAGESDAYFATRPWQARIGAWASRQSRPLDSREQLMEQVVEAMGELGVGLADAMEGDVAIPRPPFWGGYRLWAERLELWISGSGRIHDRAVWTRDLVADGDGFAGNAWRATRLQP